MNLRLQNPIPYHITCLSALSWFRH